MGISHAEEKFGLAVNELATSPKDIHGRLLDAMMQNIVTLTDADLEDVPEVLAQFRRYNAEIMSQPERTGRLVTWVNQLSVPDAVDVARWLVRSLDEITLAADSTT